MWLFKFFNSASESESLTDALMIGSTSAAAVVASPVIFGFLILNRVNPTLGNAILNKLGLGSNMHDELDLEQMLATGHYYEETEGAIAFAQQEQSERHKAHALVSKIVEKLANDYATAETLKEIPEEYLCPITLSIMVEPMRVVTFVENKEVIHYFDKDAIEGWLENHDTNPLNRQVIVSMEQDDELKQEIRNFVDDPKNHKENEEELTGSTTLAAMR
ncbi:MAG: hypothetical protein P4L79_14950 [Legionella sp.]|uniref:U-box domain-containing protein n=1 Tax=Legionella sp. TaxID=459 RepID=UPI002846B62F|nr:hypothetical protein [Legionella sp.]